MTTSKPRSGESTFEMIGCTLIATAPPTDSEDVPSSSPGKGGAYVTGVGSSTPSLMCCGKGRAGWRSKSEWDLGRLVITRSQACQSVSRSSLVG